MKRQKPKGMQWCITLDRVPLKHVTRFNYIGSRIAEDAKTDEDIRARASVNDQGGLFAKYVTNEN